MISQTYYRSGIIAHRARRNLRGLVMGLARAVRFAAIRLCWYLCQLRPLAKAFGYPFKR